ncbi:cytochrome P450 98A3 [Ephemerocybe angulata]|uniref:Cytochrome P450 98A3 n=1 Tax=Ephemerocybe angulata TaxID=980116 RepID=A0A8H6I0B5_9AGAR|nr:cytochrome P450 98A3 [Tulosesus angulatus]
MHPATIVAGGAFVWAVKNYAESKKRNPRGLPLPPGPRGLPVLGNMFQLPQSEQWKAYEELSKQYGDIVYLEAMGQPILILGALDRTEDMMEKHATIYSDRPTLPIGQFMDMSTSFAFMGYGPEWRHDRRVFHQYLNHNAVSQYYPIMEEEALNLLRKLSADTRRVPRPYSITTYGFDDVEANKRLVEDAAYLVQSFAETIVPGRYLFNSFPSLGKLPDWVPGTGFKDRMRELANLNNEVLTKPFISAKESMTVSSSWALVFAMAAYPEVQKKAQAEIDLVIGNDRLPTLSDRESLPYVAAIVKEVSRWHSVVPLGLSRASSEDSEYNGYFIPKGTIIMMNTWCGNSCTTPKSSTNQWSFIPERYLKDGKLNPKMRDPESAAFGYGTLSNDAIFLMAASMLAVFDIAPPKDEGRQPRGDGV